MKIISFAWTEQALLEGKKTVTRRCWVDKYARMFKKGDIVQAYDKSPRCGGRKIALIQLTADPHRQSLPEMTEEDLKKEGGLWKSISDFYMPCSNPYVVEFKLIEVTSNKEARG